MIIICFNDLDQHTPVKSPPVVATGVCEFGWAISEQIIEINSAVKPYSRLFIANKLDEANQQRDLLNIRQQRELDFYLLDFRKESGKERRKTQDAGHREEGGNTERESGGIAITMPADDSSSIGQQSAVSGQQSAVSSPAYNSWFFSNPETRASEGTCSIAMFVVFAYNHPKGDVLNSDGGAPMQFREVKACRAMVSIPARQSRSREGQYLYKREEDVSSDPDRSESRRSRMVRKWEARFVKDRQQWKQL